MNAPLADFIEKYAASDPVRFHMPGSKGDQRYDITEIPGADSLYCADGVIAESEKNAASLFGSGATFYSTGGSSQCVRAMLRLACIYAGRHGLPHTIVAGRNAHSSFVTAAGLLDLGVEWIYGGSGLVSCTVSPEKLDETLARVPCAAVYITSPDYLGNIADIAALAQICRARGVLLLVDNAHGAYLRFADPDLHPLTLGADVCCDSAHKTLPVLTGGAYLHISKAQPWAVRYAKSALALFGSTSPSYLIMKSLDEANRALAGSLTDGIRRCCEKLAGIRKKLADAGYVVCGDEPMKLTLSTKPHGQRGDDVAAYLQSRNIYCEFADADHIVFMPSPSNRPGDLDLLCAELTALPASEPVKETPPVLTPPVRAMSIREALLAPAEILPVGECIGMICAQPTVSCPPAVPCAVCGEIIDENTAAVFGYYGIGTCAVVR